MNPEPKVYTSGEFAWHLGMKPQTVDARLAAVSTSGVKIVKGRESKAWPFCSLPAEWQQQLEATAQEAGYRNAEHMMGDPSSVAWQPHVSLDKVTEKEIERMSKEREALKPICARSPHVHLSNDEIQAYKRATGRSITKKQLRAKVDRVIERDRGRRDFDRLELYLRERPEMKQAAVDVVEAMEVFSGISGYIGACRNPSTPSDEESIEIWERVFEQYDHLLAQGETSKRAARRLRNFLSSQPPFRNSSRPALRMLFDFKLDHRDDLRDGRRNNGKSFQIPQVDLDTVEKGIVFISGDFATSWRTAHRDGKLTPEVAARWNPDDHPIGWYPPLFKKELGERPYWLYKYHRHRRQFNSDKAHFDTIYDGLHTLSVLSADDVTLPVWFWYQPENGGPPIVTRGQCLVFIDVLSKRIVGWSLQPDKTYNGIVIYAEMKRICVEKAMPRAWLFEHGIWEKTKMIAGTSDRASISEVIHSFRALGTEFFYADTPEGKFEVENVMARIQDLMENERGYCGRDERRDRPDWIKKQLPEIEHGIESGELHPSAYLWSFDQWNDRLREIFEQYNSLPQSGKHMRGRSPEQIYIENWNEPERCGPEVSHIFDVKYEKIVKPSGIQIQSGNRVYKYYGPEIAHLVGYKALLWFDPEKPEMAVVTTLDHTDPIAIPLHPGVPRLEALTHPGAGILARESRRREGQVKGIIARYNVLKDTVDLPYRKSTVPLHQVELGNDIEFQKGALEGKQEEERKQASATENRLDGLGIVRPRNAPGELGPDAGKYLRKFLKGKSAGEQPKEETPAGVKTYVLKTAGSPQREHVDYLLKRLTEFRKAGQKSFGQSFAGEITFHSVARIARAQLKCDLYAPEHFEAVCSHLQEKIDATALGKRNTAQGIPNYHSFQEAAHE